MSATDQAEVRPSLTPRPRGKGGRSGGAATSNGRRDEGFGRNEQPLQRSDAAALLERGNSEYRLGRHSEARLPLEAAVELFSASGQTGGLIEALLSLGRAERDLGMRQEAASHFAQALELARGDGQAGAEADALNLQASLRDAEGDYAGALEHLERALVIAARAGAAERQVNLLSNIGVLHTRLGDCARAMENLQAAHRLARLNVPGSRSEAVNLLGLGRLYYDMGDFDSARDYFSNARDLGRQSDDPVIEAASLNSLANLCCRREEWSEAGALFAEALEVARRLGIRHYEIDNLDGLGQVHAAQARHDEAHSAYTEALTIAKQIGDREGEVEALMHLGKTQVATGALEAAMGWLSEGLELARAIDSKRFTYKIHEALSVVYERLGDLGLALHHEREFHRVSKVVFNDESEQRSRRLTVQFELEQARHEVEVQRLQVVQEAREAAEAEVRSRTAELEQSQQEIVTRLAAAAEFRDDETGEHTLRVGRYAAAIARELGWPEGKIALLSSAARLHDIGKIGISDAVLLKAGKLTAAEFERMSSHTIIGANILAGAKSDVLRLAQEIALAHHERWDGKGYPLGISEDAIPPSARIVAVADVLDALTQERPYKRAWPLEEALAEVRRGSGHHFDPQMVAAAMRAFAGVGLEARATAVGTQAPETGSKSSAVLGDEVTAGLGRHFGRILAERTRDLETARRDAEANAKRMEAMAFTDPLTELANRRAFEEDLAAEVVRARRSSTPIGLLCLDLDLLKTVNDNEGHERGDVLLRHCAEALRLHLRRWGRVYRVGGDEFSAILQNVMPEDRDEVLGTVERAMAEVRDKGFPNITISADMAVLPDEAVTPAELVRLGDQRMYRDKLAKRAERRRSLMKVAALS